MSGLCIAHQRYCDGLRGGNAIFFNSSEWTPSSFAWRNNDGVKPEYKGLIHAMFENGAIIQDFADSLSWGGSFNPIIQWRPVALQSDDENKKVQEKLLSALYADSPALKNVWNAIREQFRLPIGIDSPESRNAFKSLNEHLETKPKFTIKEEAPSRAMTVNIEGREYLIPSRTPTVSPKEDKPMKPVYTAEMHAKCELPPVDSKVKVCIKSAGFDVDEQDEKFEGKTVTVRAAFNNAESEKIVAVENEDGNCACYIIECIKPITKTIKVNGFDVPAPMSENIKGGDKYFFPAPAIEKYFQHTYWDGGDFDKLNLARGTIHKTQEAAIAHAKAMLGIDPNA